MSERGDRALTAGQPAERGPTGPARRAKRGNDECNRAVGKS